MPVKNTVLEAFPGYIIYFDNVRVDQFVKDFTVNLNTNGSFGQANINMIYVPSLDKIIHPEVQSNISTVKDQAAGTTKTVTTEGKKVFSVNYKGTATAELNVRSGPGTNNGYIGTTYPGGDIVVMEEHHTNDSEKIWLKIKYWLWVGGTKTGYVSGRYVRRYDGGPIPSTTPTASTSTTVTDNSNVGSGMTVKVVDGLENMTNVRIFVKNIFNNNYVQIFEGNVRTKSTSIQDNIRSFNVTAYDYLNWLNRTICPIAVPFDGTLSIGDRLRWKAQGVDLNKVKTVANAADITFKGKNVAQTWKTISDQTLAANKLYSDPNTVSMFDNPLKRVAIMGDIDEKLRKAEVMDFIITNSATQVNSVYVMMNDILRTLMFEFYQDRDGVIRIKPPFWNEHVLMSHVIDKSLIISYNETTDYNNYYTRTITNGGLEEYQRDMEDETAKSMITPVVVTTSSGIEANSGPVVVDSQVAGGRGGSSDGGGTSLGARIVAEAKKYLGVPYVWGGNSWSGVDCSSLVQRAYSACGVSIGRTTYDQVKQGSPVSGPLMMGDLLFSNYDAAGPGHVVMYIGNGQIIEAQQPGTNVLIRALPGYTQARRYLSETNTGTSAGPTNKNIEYKKPDSVGPDTLLVPTYLERKYGPLVHESTQPLIKFSTSSAVSNSKDAYDALTKYGKFMLNYMNSSLSMASIQTAAMPWIRPGFNVWIDPANIDKVFYVNGISHHGNQGGVFTTLNMTMGRQSTDFTGDKNSLGALRPGQSDDIFVNSLKVTPANFGTVCNYDSVRSIMRNRYITPNIETLTVRADADSHLARFYGHNGDKTNYTPETTAPAPAPKPQGDRASVNYKATTTASELNVRSGPGTSNPVIGSVYPGGELRVTEEVYTNDSEKTWLKVTYTLYIGGTKTGYVSGAYCRRTDGGTIGSRATATTASAGTSNSAVNSVSYMATCTRNLIVKSGPGDSYGYVGEVFPGGDLQVSEENNGWLKVLYWLFVGGTKTGYVPQQYCTRRDGGPIPSKPPIAYTLPDPVSANYRAYADTYTFSDELSANEIKSKLDGMYNGAPAVVKERAQRLGRIIDASKVLLKPMLHHEVRL